MYAILVLKLDLLALENMYVNDQTGHVPAPSVLSTSLVATPHSPCDSVSTPATTHCTLPQPHTLSRLDDRTQEEYPCCSRFRGFLVRRRPCARSLFAPRTAAVFSMARAQVGPDLGGLRGGAVRGVGRHDALPSPNNVKFQYTATYGAALYG